MKNVVLYVVMVTGLTALFVWLKGRNAERDPASSAMVVSPEGAAARPVVLVDVRTEKEFKVKRIAGAVHAPYVEKSLKEVSFNPSLDDFSAVDKLDKTKPTVFSCNGAECWKSYKASQVAVAKGFQKVYWFRGGLPEWESAGLPMTKD